MRFHQADYINFLEKVQPGPARGQGTGPQVIHSRSPRERGGGGGDKREREEKKSEAERLRSIDDYNVQQYFRFDVEGVILVSVQSSPRK